MTVPSELVWEILTWLPVKTLMRFKCVSRFCLSTILDPAFAREHRHRGRGVFRGLLMCDPDMRRAQKRDFYYLTLDGPIKQISHHLTVHHGGGGGRMMGSTETVDGLVCFYDRNHSYLFNMATRESLQLPDSAHEAQAQSYSYHLGFDPRDKLYKLLKICAVYTEYDEHHLWYAEEDAVFEHHLNSEVLTLNGGVDSLSWRNIDSSPWEIKSRSMCCCSNGVLYWWEQNMSDTDCHLIGFNLCNEKFFNYPVRLWNWYDALMFGPGGVAKILSKNSLQGKGMAKAVITSYDGNGGESTIVKFDIPYPHVRPYGILPNGKVLLYDSDCEIYFPSLIYLYDPINGCFEEIQIPGITNIPSSSSEISLPLFPSSSSSSSSSISFQLRYPPRRISGYISNYEENIITLRGLINSPHHIPHSN